jgi:hypothetical protein
VEVEMFNEITEQAYVEAVRMMFSGMSVSEGMAEYCQFLQNLIPSPIWELATELDYDESSRDLTDWFTTVLRDEPPPSDAEVLYFGLSDMGNQLGLLGYREYVEDEQGPAELCGMLYCPENQDSQSKILEDIHRIAYLGVDQVLGDIRWIGEACLPLVYAGLSTAQMLRALPVDQLLSGRENRYVAVCFDEGDFFFLGEITRSGWQYQQVPAWLSE